MPSRFASIIRNRKVFIAVIVLISFLKLLLSALSPPSLELIDIVHLFFSQQAPYGPWIAVYPPLLGNWTAREGIQAWLQAPGMATDLNNANLSLLFRFPAFLFDLGTTYLLCVIGAKLGTPTKARLAALIWFLNPYSFFSIELAGVPDVVAVFLTMLSLSLIMSRRLLWSAAILCLGIWFKLFPVILLPPIFLYLSSQGYSRRRLGAALGISILGLFGYLGWILPGSKYLLEYTPVTQPMAFLVGTPYIISVSAFGLILFFGVLVLFAKRNMLVPTLISTFMIYYALSNPSPQYFVWALPLIALDLMFVSPSRGVVAATLYVLVFVQWFFVSIATITTYGYALFVFPVISSSAPSFLNDIALSLQNGLLLAEIILPIVSSALFACSLIYAIDAARCWFSPSLPQRA